MINRTTRRAVLLLLLVLTFGATACADDSLIGPTRPGGPSHVPEPPKDVEPIEMMQNNTASDVVVDTGICSNLNVPAGQQLALRLYAAGDQIYRWNGSSWTFVAPSALLYSAPGERAYYGTHYAGPTWESRTGSRVMGAVAERCSPDSQAIPWLLLKVVDTQGAGPFRNVEYIQRIHTAGGLAPTSPGTFVGEEVGVPYTTVYTFFKPAE